MQNALQVTNKSVAETYSHTRKQKKSTLQLSYFLNGSRYRETTHIIGFAMTPCDA